MKSGVYLLQFANGARYIGKSIDIENRWKQHFDKFRKGTAARAMQAAFNAYGYPECSVICTAHPDHIDILEACYISRVNPELNSDRPSDPFLGVDGGLLTEMIRAEHLLCMSTWDHLIMLKDMEAQRDSAQENVESLNEEIDELEQLNDSLLIKRSQEVLDNDTNGRIKQLLKEVKVLNHELGSASAEILTLEEKLAYARLPWWKRLFH